MTAVLIDRSGALPAWDLDDAPSWQVVTPVVERLRDGHGLPRWPSCGPSDLEDPGPADAADRATYEAEWLGRRCHPPAGAGRRRAALPAHRRVGAGASRRRAPAVVPAGLVRRDDRLDRRVPGGRRRSAAVVPSGRCARGAGRPSLRARHGPRPRSGRRTSPRSSRTRFVSPRCSPISTRAWSRRCWPPTSSVGRLLMEHVDGPALPTLRAEPAAWTATLERLAEAQRVLAEDPVVLSMAGVPAALARCDLAASIPRLLADDDLLLMVGRSGGLTRRRGRAVRSRSGGAGRCRRVARRRRELPSSLDHGDFSASQVIIGEMGPVILDWSDATVTHPFLAAASFLMDPAGRPAGLDADLAAAYLAPWSGHADRADAPGRRSERSRLVLPLHMAALYADRILPGLDQRVGDGADGAVVPAVAARGPGYPPSVTRTRIPDDVLSAAHARSAARAARDWAEADRLRAEIEAAGWKVVDRGTDFALTPAAPPDVVEGDRVRYGASGNVPSRLDDPAVGLATVVLLATDRAGRPRAGAARVSARTPPTARRSSIVADDPSDDAGGGARRHSTTRRPRSSGRATDSAGRGRSNAGIRRATGPVVVLLGDGRRARSGDIVTPLVRALDDPSVASSAAGGARHRRSADVRRPRQPGDVDVVDGCRAGVPARRRRRRGPLDERFHGRPYLDTWWSLVLRDEGEGSPPRRAVALADVAGRPRTPTRRAAQRDFSRCGAHARPKRDFYRRRLDAVRLAPRTWPADPCDPGGVGRGLARDARPRQGPSAGPPLYSRRCAAPRPTSSCSASCWPSVCSAGALRRPPPTARSGSSPATRRRSIRRPRATAGPRRSSPSSSRR